MNLHLPLTGTMGPVTLKIINATLLDRLARGNGKWRLSPIWHDGIVTQTCDCGERISLVVHSLELLDDQCYRNCPGISRITDEAPTTWLPSGFATGSF